MSNKLQVREMIINFRRCITCDKLRSEHDQAFGAPEHEFVSF